MVLAQLSFDQGKFADGVQLLQGTLSKAPAAMVPEIDDLIAGRVISASTKPWMLRGHMRQRRRRRPCRVSGRTERSKAARSYETGGDTARARAIGRICPRTSRTQGSQPKPGFGSGQAEAKAAGRG